MKNAMLDDTLAAEFEAQRPRLTNVVSRVSLDMLRSRGVRRELSAKVAGEPIAPIDLEADAILADSVSQAFLVVLNAAKQLVSRTRKRATAARRRLSST